MSGHSFHTFVPLHLSALERQEPSLFHDWVHSWYGSPTDCLWTSPSDWFTTAHHHGRCIWIPPPAAAAAMLDQLGMAIHKRPHHTHLVLIPRLMTSKWRKMLGKVCDLVFTVPVGADIWGVSQYEPLIVGLSFPLIKHRPWRLRDTPMLARVAGLLRELPETSPQWGGHLLRELCLKTRTLDALPAGMVRHLLHPDGSR